MSGQGPGFVDTKPRPPVLLPAQPGAPTVIEPDWRPEALAQRPPASSLAWLLGGVALLLLGWVGLSVVELVLAAFDRAPLYGWAAAAVLAGAVAMLLAAGAHEWRAWRALARVDRLRALLAAESGAIGPAQAAVLDWLTRLAPGLGETETARQAVLKAASVAELRAALQHHVAARLAESAAQAGQRAAVQAGALVALAPHPALDALLVGLRGLRLVREVAALHGLRPGALATLSLARRVLSTAAGTAGVDLLSQGLADQLLHNLPGLRHLAAAVPGATLAAVRLYRLARVTALACSPLARGG